MHNPKAKFPKTETLGTGIPKIHKTLTLKSRGKGRGGLTWGARGTAPTTVSPWVTHKVSARSRTWSLSGLAARRAGLAPPRARAVATVPCSPSPPRNPWTARVGRGLTAPPSSARRSCAPASMARRSGERSSAALPSSPARAASPAPEPPSRLSPPLGEEREGRGEMFLGFQGGASGRPFWSGQGRREPLDCIRRCPAAGRPAGQMGRSGRRPGAKRARPKTAGLEMIRFGPISDMWVA